MRSGPLGLLSAALCLACTASIGDSNPGSGPGAPGPGPRPPAAGPGEPPPPIGVTGPGAAEVEKACKVRDAGPSPIRRLTRWEYDNTVRDLLGDASRPSGRFPPDERGAGFTNDAQNLSVSPLHVENYLDAAEKLVAAATVDLGRLVPCDPAAGDAGCATRFLETWGKRAWRRPLDAEEKAAMLKVFTAGMTADGFATGIRMMMQVMLQVPQFLYRVEIGGARVGGDMVRLTPWETASRLSYLFWASMPDNELMAAAEAGKLGTPEEIAAQARRLVADDRAKQTLAIFNEQWLDLASAEAIEKDPEILPAFEPALPPLFRREAELYVEEVMWRGDGTLATLLTAPFSFMNEKLARFYGVKGPAGEAFAKVTLDGVQRSGFFTQAAFLATHALPTQTDPVRRGKFVREQFFCQIPPPPPADLMVRPPDLAPNLTTRERFSQHSADPQCAVCHKMMDPIGLAFENYDPLGQYRASEAGRPVDASGELHGTDVDGPFVGPLELTRKLLDSGQVRACYVKQWFRFGYGRSETPADLCSVETLKALYESKGRSARELLVALTQTDAFMFRRAGGAP
jgi:Protein of unknown function (DUF1592)/Protein of unknown function (DUF1588)/Protein of unknown function (DUF1587)/Protein of unknown function (DUF1595)/Protein of unknown function (DUF1585)